MRKGGLCWYCDKIIKPISRMSEHLLKEHLGIKRCKCGCGNVVEEISTCRCPPRFKDYYNDEHRYEHVAKLSTETKIKRWEECGLSEKELLGIIKTKNTKKQLPKRNSHNKIKEEDLIEVKCKYCGKILKVVPCIAKTKKYCSKICKDKSRIGVSINAGNKPSIYAGKGLCGRYFYSVNNKWILFRSSYELSFILQCEKKGYSIICEPFKISFKDYHSVEFKDMPEKSKYTPDYLIEDTNTVVEIKPKKRLNEEMVRLKISLLLFFCDDKGYEWDIVTEDDLNLIKPKEIAVLVTSGKVTLFRKRDKDKYGQTT